MPHYSLRRLLNAPVIRYQIDMYLATVIAAGIMFFVGILATRDGGWWLLPVWMLALSPVAMFVLRWWREGVDLPLFNRRASKAFMYGDTLALPVMFGFAGYGWQLVPTAGWMTSYWFVIGCMLFGVAVTSVFRLVDGKRYIKSGNEAMLYCPTKVWHDFAVFPVAISLLSWLLLPQLFMAWSVATTAALVCLLLFFVLALVDVVDPPDPKRQHVKWDKEEFCPVL